MNTKIIIIIIITVAFIGGLLWLGSLNSDPNIISTRGLHWHPRLEIYVNEDKQEIPANIGIGMQYASKPTFDRNMKMAAMHTHEPNGTIHLEFPGSVKLDDTKLKNFFMIWGKDFMEFGPAVKMMVNGEENLALGEYEMKDGDKIQLFY